MKRNRKPFPLARGGSVPVFLGIAAAVGLLAGGIGFAQGPARASSLIANGTFDDPDDPFKGWIIDYAWTKNSFYAANKDHVSVVAQVDGRSQVVFLGKDESKMETLPIPFEPGYRYRGKLDVKKGKFPMRIYFAGYKWKPGIRPYGDPEIWDLQNIYRSKAAEPSGTSWSQVQTELPGTADLSDLAKGMLRQVRFITLYIWTGSPAYVDNVVIEKIPDPSVKFE